MNRALVFFVALLFLFLGSSVFWYAANRKTASNAGSVSEVDADYVPPEDQLTEFDFTDQFAKDFGSKDLEGKVWLGSFFFADCPGICVTQNAEIAKLHRRFRDRGVMIVNITVQPDTDSPAKLWTYANRFEADYATWRFLTGRDIQYVRKVGAEFFALPAADSTHTSEVAVFDRAGKMHGTYNVNKPEEFTRLVTKVEGLLADKAVSTEEDTAEATETSPAAQDS